MSIKADDPVVLASLERLGISQDQLLSAEDRAYKFMVRYCRDEGELPTPSQVAKSIDRNSGSITRIMDKLMKQGRIAKIGLGKYVPIVEGLDHPTTRIEL